MHDGVTSHKTRTKITQDKINKYFTCEYPHMNHHPELSKVELPASKKYRLTALLVHFLFAKTTKSVSHKCVRLSFCFHFLNPFLATLLSQPDQLQANGCLAVIEMGSMYSIVIVGGALVHSSVTIKRDKCVVLGSNLDP